MGIKCAIMCPQPEWPLPHHKELEERLSTTVLYGLERRAVKASILPVMAVFERAYSHIADKFPRNRLSQTQAVAFDDTVDAAAFDITYSHLTVCKFIINDEISEAIHKLDSYIAFTALEPSLFWTEESLDALLHSRAEIGDIERFTTVSGHDEAACIEQNTRLVALYKSELMSLLSSNWN